VLSAVTTSLLVCVVKLFVWYVAVCCLHVCVPDVLVCGMFGCEQTSHRQVHEAHTHTQTTYSHIPNKQLDDADKQRSSNSTKHGRRPPEDGQTIVTETCRVLMMCFTNIFNNLGF
jgi:hypothetical protein